MTWLLDGCVGGRFSKRGVSCYCLSCKNFENLTLVCRCACMRTVFLPATPVIRDHTILFIYSAVPVFGGPNCCPNREGRYPESCPPLFDQDSRSCQIIKPSFRAILTYHDSAENPAGTKLTKQERPVMINPNSIVQHVGCVGRHLAYFSLRRLCIADRQATSNRYRYLK
jgi:hypothetical protein